MSEHIIRDPEPIERELLRRLRENCHHVWRKERVVKVVPLLGFPPGKPYRDNNDVVGVAASDSYFIEKCLICGMEVDTRDGKRRPDIGIPEKTL